MERHHDGEQERRRNGIDRNPDERRFRDRNDQDFTRDDLEHDPSRGAWAEPPDPFGPDPFGVALEQQRRFERGTYGGSHRSQQGWREQRGSGRDIARDLGLDADPYGGRFEAGRVEAGRFGGRGPRDYQRGDERVREDVCDCLTADAHVDASNITITVQGGEVTLEGTVDDRRAKRRAEDWAEAVSGVRQVHNRLSVQTQNRSDEEMQPFQWRGERAVPSARGRDGYYGGRAAGGRYGERRSGSVATEQQGAWLAEEPGRFGNRGPKGYQRSDDRIREDVCDRLTADVDVDASDLTVVVKDGEVTLEGSVGDRTMKRRAEDCADDVPGVRQVHNRLAVQPQGRSAEPATSIGTSGSAASASRGGTA